MLSAETLDAVVARAFEAEARGRFQDALKILGAFAAQEPTQAFPFLYGARLAARIENLGLLQWKQRAAVDTPGIYAENCGTLPSRTILAAIPWLFGVQCPLFNALLDCGFYLAVVRDYFPGEREAFPEIIIDADFRAQEVDGVNLWEVTCYSIAMATETVPDRITLDEHGPEISEWFSRAASLIGLYQRYFAFFRPECVLLTQGYVIDSAILRLMAKKLGLRVLSFENTLVKDRFVWDDESGITVFSALPRAFFLSHGEGVSSEEADLFAETHLSARGDIKQDEHVSPRNRVPDAQDDRPVLLFLGQVYTDSSVLFGIRGFADQISAMEVTTAWAVEQGYRVIIKLHPKEAEGASPIQTPYRRLSFRKICNIPSMLNLMESGHVIIDHDNKYDTQRLIDSAALCVTVTSQAGLEAALAGKPVLLCGQAYYGGLGFTWEADGPDHLRDLLPIVAEAGFSLERQSRARAFFNVFLNTYARPKVADAIVALMRERGLISVGGKHESRSHYTVL